MPLQSEQSRLPAFESPQSQRGRAMVCIQAGDKGQGRSVTSQVEQSRPVGIVRVFFPLLNHNDSVKDTATHSAGGTRTPRGEHNTHQGIHCLAPTTLPSESARHRIEITTATTAVASRHGGGGGRLLDHCAVREYNHIERDLSTSYGYHSQDPWPLDSRTHSFAKRGQGSFPQGRYQIHRGGAIARHCRTVRHRTFKTSGRNKGAS